PGYLSVIPGRAYGGVRIVDAPRDAEVFADGYYVGIVDDFDGVFQHLNLEAGPHRIEIRAPGLAPIAFDVLVEPGRTITYRAPFAGRFAAGGALGGAITAYVRTLISVLIAAVIIEKLAPSFSAHGDTAQALKLVAYACTPVWLAGVFYLIWFLWAPASLIAAIYAIYLFYLGVGPVMKTPADKVIP